MIDDSPGLLKMHDESEMTRQKTEEDLTQPGDGVSVKTDIATDDGRSTENVTVVDFQPGEPANPHNWSEVRRLLHAFGILLLVRR